MNTDFQALQKDILHFSWEIDPVQATGLGIHTYDNRYASYDQSRKQENLNQKKSYLQRLQAINPLLLSQDEQIDLKILTAYLAGRVNEAEERRYTYINPALYPNEALYGVQQLQSNYAMPLDQRVVNIIGRLNDMPRLLAEGEANLKTGIEEIPAPWIELALDAVRSGNHFLEDIVPQFSGTVPQYFKALLESNTAAIKALHHYEKFLHEIHPAAKGSFACGKEYFDTCLRDKHFFNYTVDELLEIGRESVQHTEKLLHEIAEELKPGENWQALVQKYRDHYPAADQVLQHYKKETERIRDFVKKEDLITIPAEETLVIMETPIFQRSMVPYSGYVTPAPFDDHPIGYFWITPMHSGMSEAEQLERLRAHNTYDITLTAIHHAYPGQHLQYVLTHQHTSPVRNSFPDPFFTSGWPLYCEEMLYTEGLYTDLRTRLFQLKDQLWRDYRVMIDAQLHLGQMTFEEAIQLLTEKVMLDRASAEAEVKRYSLYPTQAVGFLLGKREIIRLRQEISELEGDDFSLKRFHDNLMSFGNIPLPLVRSLLLKLTNQRLQGGKPGTKDDSLSPNPL